MMGLEPTTFCMASEPWDEFGELRNPHGGAETSALAYPVGSAEIAVLSGRFPADLGTRTYLVPNAFDGVARAAAKSSAVSSVAGSPRARRGSAVPRGSNFFVLPPGRPLAPLA